MPRILGAILAGGKASRMGGINKALLSTRPGQSTLQHIIRQMERAGLTDVAILANDPIPYLSFGPAIIPDIHPGAGPLAGIEAALFFARQRGCDALCILPCDVPAITYREIQTLIAAFSESLHAVYATTPGNKGHFACAVIPTRALPVVTASLVSQNRSLEALLRKLRAKPVLFREASAFLNLNRPDDLKKWADVMPSPVRINTP